MTDTDNKEEWKKVMAQEIQQLEDHGTWEQVPISNAKTKILPLTWVLCCKQSPDARSRSSRHASVCEVTYRKETTLPSPCHLLDLCPYLFGIVNHLPLDNMHYQLLECICSGHIKRTCLDSPASRFPVKRSKHLPTHEMFYLQLKLCALSLVAAHLAGS
jgi:hypothetical protein